MRESSNIARERNAISGSRGRSKNIHFVEKKKENEYENRSWSTTFFSSSVAFSIFAFFRDRSQTRLRLLIFGAFLN